jgi:hypothetical protein
MKQQLSFPTFAFHSLGRSVLTHNMQTVHPVRASQPQELQAGARHLAKRHQAPDPFLAQAADGWICRLLLPCNGRLALLRLQLLSQMGWRVGCWRCRCRSLSLPVLLVFGLLGSISASSAGQSQA